MAEQSFLQRVLSFFRDTMRNVRWAVQDLGWLVQDGAERAVSAVKRSFGYSDVDACIEEDDVAQKILDAFNAEEEVQRRRADEDMQRRRTEFYRGMDARAERNTASYRCLIGPIAFLGRRMYIIYHIDESGRGVRGVGTTVVDAQSDLDSRILTCSWLADGGVWVASGDLIAALGLPSAMQGAPNHHQRDMALAMAMTTHDPGRLWAFQNLPRFGVACDAFARLASLTDGYPEGQSFPFQAIFDGDFITTLWGSLSFGRNRIAVSLFNSKADLLACYDAAMGGKTEAAMINTSVVVLDLTGGPWMCGLTKDLLGHGFAPQVFQRRNGVQERAHESTVNLLAAVAMAAPAQPQLEKQGSGAFCADDFRISCDLRLIDTAHRGSVDPAIDAGARA